MRVVLLLAVCLPLNAHALGFGKPAVESALGEPLRIVLPIVALESGELDELVARLAAQNWFQLSGLDYGEINDQLNVVVDTGLQAVVISTLQPVSQVVVPLVIELEGPRKVMRKQFTVLINPASYEEAVTASTNTGAPATGLNLAEGVTGNATATALPATEQTANQEISSSSLSTPPASASPQSTVAGSLVRPDRVVVAKGESLSTIVDRFLPDGANRYQGRMAFYNDNPSAFYQGNIHNLTRGAELIVPPAEDILALPAAEARRAYQTLASKPVPGEEAVTAANPSGGAEVVDSSAGSQSQAAADEPQQAGFRLSVLEVADASEEDAVEQGDTPAAGSSATSGEGGDTSEESAALSAVATGEQFQMQGFTMKLSAMNAYIVELQEENQQLKDRVAALEEKVQALITREAAIPVTEDRTAAAIGSDIADEEVVLTDEPLAVEQNNEQDLASVLTNSGGLFTEQELKEIAAEVAEPDSEVAAVDNGAVADVKVIEQPDVSAEADQSAGDTAATALTDESEPAIDSEVNTTVEQMLADLDAELNDVKEQYNSVVAETEQPEDTAALQSDTDGASDRVVVGSSQTGSDVADSPKATFLQGLQDKAKTLLGDLNGPILQLIVAVILLAALLFAWMMRRGKNKPEVTEKEQPAAVAYEPPAGSNVGVTYSGADNELSLLLDDEDEQWMSQPDISMENLDTLQESDVDLITQSEVYLTYNRPMQAVQALTEEYSKKDSDKFVVGSRLIKVFEKIGSSDERNTAMRNFIVTLNNDIEEFTNSEWDALRFDLDALRRNEQAAAIDDHDKETSIDMNSFNPLAEPESLQDGRGAPQLDESVIDLDFHTSDKSG